MKLDVLFKQNTNSNGLYLAWQGKYWNNKEYQQSEALTWMSVTGAEWVVN